MMLIIAVTKTDCLLVSALSDKYLFSDDFHPSLLFCQVPVVSDANHKIFIVEVLAFRSRHKLCCEVILTELSRISGDCQKYLLLYHLPAPHLRESNKLFVLFEFVSQNRIT